MRNLFILPLLLFISCRTETTQSIAATHTLNIPTELMMGIEAHGGIDQWKKMRTMEFSFPKGDGKELHQIDLQSRKVRISHPNYTLGFDGEEVWVIPSKEAFGLTPPRFYHNLIFYFYAIPFVLADPGINYEVLPQKVINGRTYNSIKITYDANVGDAPKDYYIAHFDSETNELYLLLYTVTYFSGETNEKFNALIYDNWKVENGLKVPTVMKGHKYEADSIGEMRYERFFDDIKLSSEPLDQAIFEIPEGAEIDTLVQY